MKPSMMRSIRSFSSAATTSASTKASPLFDFRRLRVRSNVKAQEERDPDYWVLPRERLGKDYDLNWAINSYRITPKYNAYRNLHTTGLLNRVGKLDANKAVHINSAAKEDHAVYYYLGKSPLKLTSPATVTTEQYNHLMKVSRKHLSYSNHLFVHDGALGSEKIRTFTDNPVVELFLKNNLFSTAVNAHSPKDFSHSLSAYIVSCFPTQELENVGLKKTCSFTILDVETGKALIADSLSIPSLRSSLSQLAAASLLNNGSVVLPSYSVSVGGKKILLVGSEDLISKFVVGQNVIGAHQHVLTSSGYSPLWAGRTSPLSKDYSTAKGDIVESGARVTHKIQSPSASDKLSAVYFFSSGAQTQVAKKNQVDESVLTSYQSSLTGESKQITERLNQLLKELNVESYQVNVAASEKSNLSSLLKL